jgi:hypothetical protein
MLAASLLGRAQSEGGFGVVMARGDADSGALLVLLCERGIREKVVERILQPNGRYEWRDSALEDVQNDECVEKFLARRRGFDPDMWILELDIASAERFAAEMTELD